MLKYRKIIPVFLGVLLIFSMFTINTLSSQHVTSAQELIIEETYEAEDGEGEGFIIDNKHNGFTGEGFIDFNPNVPGGYVEWIVNMPVAGEFILDFRYAHAGGSERPAEVSINGDVIEKLPFPPTGDWAGWINQSFTAELDKGKSLIRLSATGAEGGGNIDHLRIHNNFDTEDDNVPIHIEEVEMTEIVSSLQMKKLNELGIISTMEGKADDPINALDFMALINTEFGFVASELFKNMVNPVDIGFVAKDEWGIYVAEAARDQQYIPDFLWDELELTRTLTKREVVLIVGDLLDLVPEDEEDPGMIGKLAKQGLMNPNNKYGIKSNLTWSEAKEVVRSLAEDSDKPTEKVTISRTVALTENLIAVTLNGTFDSIDLNDLAVSIPTGNWNSLTPVLNKNLRIPKAAVGSDEFGNTVIIMQSLDELHGDKYFLEKESQEFTGNLDAAIKQADNMISWQIEHGGWSKAIDYSESWNGEESRSEWVNSDGVELGMIDNDATIKEISFLSEVYSATGDSRYKESVEAGIDFLMNLQYETGGFAQVYPARGNYSDMVTFNDEAMIRVLDMFDDIVNQEYPFHSGVIDEQYHEIIETSLKDALDYILQAQIEVDGNLTAWGAQHDPFTYESVQARAYEHPSISGKESIGIVRFLMSRPEQTDEVKNAITSALNWYDENKLEGIRYVSGGDENGEYFVEDSNAITWYRFYEIGTNSPIFSGRDGIIKHDIHEIEEERRNGYQWGGGYATHLLETAKTTGYFVDNVYVQVINTKSTDILGRTLKEGQIEKVEDLSYELEKSE